MAVKNDWRVDVDELGEGLEGVVVDRMSLSKWIVCWHVISS